ncbi:hypothetical protein TNIN_209981 [Trichonephila inaurata madagascariensis]|uniref:Secreted protein n=1 Tax=Trichonephila inaurata madagascariensis TaxID=2747483 RepID=A0A8X6M9T1_9ARAC|nr:hypothetical protein TNIN_209981 [Trichonephila inaurata madagascariensis]
MDLMTQLVGLFRRFFPPVLLALLSRGLLADRLFFSHVSGTQTEKKRPPGVGSLKNGSPLSGRTLHTAHDAAESANRKNR